MNKYAIDVETLNKQISGNKKVTLLDVRRKVDFEASANKISGALWRDPEKIDH